MEEPEDGLSRRDLLEKIARGLGLDAMKLVDLRNDHTVLNVAFKQEEAEKIKNLLLDNMLALGDDLGPNKDTYATLLPAGNGYEERFVIQFDLQKVHESDLAEVKNALKTAMDNQTTAESIGIQFQWGPPPVAPTSPDPSSQRQATERLLKMDPLPLRDPNEPRQSAPAQPGARPVGTGTAPAPKAPVQRTGQLTGDEAMDAKKIDTSFKAAETIARQQMANGISAASAQAAAQDYLLKTVANRADQNHDGTLDAQERKVLADAAKKSGNDAKLAGTLGINLDDPKALEALNGALAQFKAEVAGWNVAFSGRTDHQLGLRKGRMEQNEQIAADRLKHGGAAIGQGQDIPPGELLATPTFNVPSPSIASGKGTVTR